MSNKIKWMEREVEVKTLTVRQVKELADDLAQLKINVVDLLLDDAVPAVAVEMATGITIEEMSGDIDPVELRKLWDAVRKKNPFFARMMDRLAEAGKQQPVKPEPSSVPPAI